MDREHRALEETMKHTRKVIQQFRVLGPVKDESERRERVIEYMAAQFMDWADSSGADGKEFDLTPTLRGTGEPLHLRIGSEDALRIHCRGRSRGLKGIVTDLRTKKRYKIYGASCGLAHCMCASTAVEIEEDIK